MRSRPKRHPRHQSRIIKKARIQMSDTIDPRLPDLPTYHAELQLATIHIAAANTPLPPVLAQIVAQYVGGRLWSDVGFLSKDPSTRMRCHILAELWRSHHSVDSELTRLVMRGNANYLPPGLPSYIDRHLFTTLVHLIDTNAPIAELHDELYRLAITFIDDWDWRFKRRQWPAPNSTPSCDT